MSFWASKGNGKFSGVMSDEQLEDVRKRRRNGSRIPTLEDLLDQAQDRLDDCTSEFRRPGLERTVAQRQRELQAEKQWVADQHA